MVNIIAKLFKAGSGDTLRRFNQASVIKRMLPKEMGYVCELGCGHAGPLYSYWLINRASKYVGVDGYKPNIELARQRHSSKSGVTFLLSDVTSVKEIPNESCDVLVSTEFLEHVDDDGKMIQEMIRILKPGGIAVLSTPLIYSENTTPQIKKTTAIDPNRFEEHKVEGFVERILVDKLERNGFVITGKQYCFYWPARFGLSMGQHFFTVIVALSLSLLDRIFAALRCGKPYDIILLMKRKVE